MKSQLFLLGPVLYLSAIGVTGGFVAIRHYQRAVSSWQRLSSSLSTTTTKASNELCDVEFADTSITSTFAKGTPENDIILSWEPELAAEIQDRLAKHTSDRPFMIAVIGNPGSGKTTSCHSLSGLMDDCFVLPFDGYHLPMEDLMKSPNAQDLIYRRGAPDTFHPSRLANDLDRIRDGKEGTISIPGFDHALGDPEPDAHKFERSKHKIVFCEGLYLLHDNEEWHGLKERFDMSIFVEANVDLCVERLKIRNLCIPGYTEEEIIQRVDAVDRLNAHIVEASKKYATHVVQSAAERTLTTTMSDGTPSTDVNVSWEEEFSTRLRQALKDREDTSTSSASNEPYMVSIVGGPGCGKTTSCQVLSDLLEDVGVMVLPFHGYHIPLDDLRQMADGEDKIYRRGAPDTFQADKLKSDLERIRRGPEATVKVPGFDHALGDPAPDQYEFDRSKHRVVLCEGLYLLHDQDEWKTTKDYFDYNVFIDADVDACIESLKIRNKCIPGYTEEEIETRCEEVDRVHAEIVDHSKVRADLVVSSMAHETRTGSISRPL